jgi:thioredoxin 1
MAENGNVVTVTNENFAEVTGQGLSMIDFWAEWCGPCRMVAPFVEQIADEFVGQVKVGKLDVDSNQQIATQYNVRSIPTILFLKDGKVVDTVVGAVPRQALESKLRQLLPAAA